MRALPMAINNFLMWKTPIQKDKDISGSNQVELSILQHSGQFT